MSRWSENKVWRLILAPSNTGYKYLLLPGRLLGKAPVQQPNLTEQNSVYERNRRKFVQVEVHSELESLLLAENEGHAAVTQTRSRWAQTLPRCCSLSCRRSLLPVAACCCLLLLAAVRNYVRRHVSKFKSPPSRRLMTSGTCWPSIGSRCCKKLRVSAYLSFKLLLKIRDWDS